ncbi:MAG: hypothetical protein EOP04_09390 [Proteobacteria bacterium]|nr:MAG: hypothetical protein EOP04_09390 [Pseudomonadota bacterium]
MNFVCVNVMVVLISCLSTALSFGSESAKGPFPIRRTRLEKLSFTYNRKLEKPTQALKLSKQSPGLTELSGGVLVIKDNTTVNYSEADELTGELVKKSKVLTAGTVLDPQNNPGDDLLLPKGLMVGSEAVASGDLTFGRFAYLGVAPRFDSKNLEMFASKMGHTVRVKGFITQSLMDSYEFQLLSKFKAYVTMLMKSTVHLDPLKSLAQMAEKDRNFQRKKWTTVASYYSQHLLENSELDIYASAGLEIEYKRTILLSLIRTYLNDPSATIEQGLALYDQYKADPLFSASRAETSRALFIKNLGALYVPGQFENRPDAVGMLNFVYPIAIDMAGPFGMPSPGLRKFPLSSSIEGRWFSTRWLDEFGGFPFIMITPDGVAFHGPITMNSANDTWYLKRDNVSHSCMRMDASDLMELRALLPKNMNALERLGQTIPLKIMEWPDVDDVNLDGSVEAIDVAYYTVPSPSTTISDVEAYRPERINKTYWKKMFSPYVNRLRSRNTFTIHSSPEGMNTAEFTGLPRYELINGSLKMNGFYEGVIPLYTFPQRPTQIIQYREDGVRYTNGADGGDYDGSYTPGVVNRF